MECKNKKGIIFWEFSLISWKIEFTTLFIMYLIITLFAIHNYNFNELMIRAFILKIQDKTDILITRS